MIFHPAYTTISAYADDDLSPRRRARIAAHLQKCPGCRRTLQGVRDLTAAARQIESPAVPQDALARIVARRGEGERVILPLADPLPPARRRLPAGPIAAAVAAVAASMAILQARPPEGQLRLTPAGPHAGGVVTVDFRSAPGVSQLERVFLRARYRAAGDTAVGPDIPEATVAELRRQGPGAFRGILILPDSVVYAALVVEDGRGRRFDGTGPGWELLVHGDRAPRYDAFVQQQRHRLPHLSGAIESARRALAAYPEMVDARRRLGALEARAVKQREADLAAQADRLPLLSR